MSTDPRRIDIPSFCEQPKPTMNPYQNALYG